MVELLRQGGVSASYQVGTITLNGAQFYNWSGFTDAKSACQFLADGAIPATVNGASSCGSLTGNVTSVVMGHSYATSLQSWISSYNANNQTNLQVEDIVGGGVIDTTAAFNIWSGSASLPAIRRPLRNIPGQGISLISSEPSSPCSSRISRKRSLRTSPQERG